MGSSSLGRSRNNSMAVFTDFFSSAFCPWFSFHCGCGTALPRSAKACAAIVHTRSVTSKMSLSSRFCAVLKVNQNCRSLFQDVPREGVEIYPCCGFGGGFTFVWNGFFGLSVVGLISTSCFAATTSLSSASLTNLSSVKI